MARALDWFKTLSGFTSLAGASNPESAPSSRAAAGRKTDPKPSVLAVGMSAADCDTLGTVAEAESWNHLCADSLRTALEILKHDTMPLVLLDRAGCGVDWRKALEALVHAAPGSCIFLVSRVNDDYLLQEVVLRRGFDVISPPFSNAQLRHEINRGWLFWKSEATGRVGEHRKRVPG